MGPLVLLHAVLEPQSLGVRSSGGAGGACVTLGDAFVRGRSGDARCASVHGDDEGM